MYLAKCKIKGESHYFIRESYRDGDCLRSRDLCDLGTNPAKHIVYPGGNAYYIDEVVEGKLASLGVEPSMDEMDEIFWSFLEPGIRRVLGSIRQRAKSKQRKVPLTPEQEKQIWIQVSEFDKRRIHYLRFGRLDQGRIGLMPVKLYKWIFDKSRDEIEQRFLKMEQRLNPSELKTYTYVIFDLQRFFTQSWAKQIPQGLDQDMVEKHFLDEICLLNRNVSLWGDHKAKGFLNEYLIRYVIMFFDYQYAPDTFLRDYIKRFMDTRREWRPPPVKSSVSFEEASTIFGVKKDILKTMSKRGLVRLYRRMAKKLHPDKGGTQEGFVRLTEAYGQLLKTKTERPRRFTRRY